MDFTFNLNDVFQSDILKINYSLIPQMFEGDKRGKMHQISQVIDALGVASAKAQDLHQPITSAEKLRNCEHTLYVMIEPNDNNGKGSAVGLLKVGVKNLFLYDENGMVHEMKSLCLLDFYIHESKQRNGFGKKLFEFMLEDQDVKPCKLAFDAPTDKLISFLNKYYGLRKIFPQTNNFILFEGFFDEKCFANAHMGSLDSSGAPDRIEKDNRNCFDNHSVTSEGYTPTLYGRHTAVKAKDTMEKMTGEDSTYAN